MSNEYDHQLEEELEEASERATSGLAAAMGESICLARQLAKKAGRDVSARIGQIEKIGYTYGARFKLQDAKQLIADGKKDVARIALFLVQRYSSLAEDETTFFEAE